MAPAKYDERKPGELIVLIASLSRDDPAFGDVKLNKLLFFSDFLAYTNLGQPITGAEYQKLDFGPARRTGSPAAPWTPTTRRAPTPRCGGRAQQGHPRRPRRRRSAAG